MSFAVTHNDANLSDLPLGAWDSFCTWTENLKLEKYPELCHLADHGYSDQIDDLLKKFKIALTLEAPDSQIALSVAEQLQSYLDNKALRTGEQDDVLVVSDGPAD